MTESTGTRPLVSIALPVFNGERFLLAACRSLLDQRYRNIELIIGDIRAELAGRPYELVAVAGGWQHRTKKIFGDTIRAAFGKAAGEGAKELSPAEALVLMCIAYFQPITRAELSSFFG